MSLVEAMISLIYRLLALAEVIDESTAAAPVKSLLAPGVAGMLFTQPLSVSDHA